MSSPTLIRRAGNFSLAYFRWMFHGWPTRSQDEINTIVDICHMCPSHKFNGSYCEDMRCGCFISKRRWLSKVGWASEHCPDQHW